MATGVIPHQITLIQPLSGKDEITRSLYTLLSGGTTLPGRVIGKGNSIILFIRCITPLAETSDQWWYRPPRIGKATKV